MRRPKNTSFFSIRATVLQFGFRSSFRRICFLVLLVVLVLPVQAAEAATAIAKGGEIHVYTAPEEISSIVETVSDSSTLSPIAETTSGGAKWFIVKTKSGNTGWIKAGDHAQIKQVHDYFRSLPKDHLALAPSSATEKNAITPSGGNASRIPIVLRGASVFVRVTFNRAVSGYLLVDTGAYQTFISKRIAAELRMPPTERRVSYGVAGAVTHDVGLLDSIRVGPFELRNFQVSILENIGLLGFDFLGQFHTTIDPDKKEMILSPRKQ